MLCIDLTSNGKEICTAGLPEGGIVSATLGSGTHVCVPPRPGFELSVNGVDGDALVEWATRGFFLGDSLTVTIVEAQPDLPTRRYSDPDVQRLAEEKGLLHARGMYRVLKRRLRELEEEYGDQLVSEEDA
jgi:hypothetical protein